MNRDKFNHAKTLLTATFAKAPGFDAGADFGYMYGSSESATKLRKAIEALQKLADTYNSEDARQTIKELQN